MEKIIFSSRLNQSATIADIMSLSADEFNATLAEIKAEWKVINNVPAKKKAVKPYNFVLQKMKKTSKQWKKIGGIGEWQYLQMDELLKHVCKEHADYLSEIGYSGEQFKVDFATKTAEVMANAIFHCSYMEWSGCWYIQDNEGGKRCFPDSMSVAAYFLFKGAEQIMEPFTNKKVTKDYAKVLCSSGLDTLQYHFEEMVLHFHPCSDLDKYIARCAVVQKVCRKGEKTLEIEEVNEVINNVCDDVVETLPSSPDDEENTIEDEGVDEINV
jgi:hypothetical protein